MPRTKSSANSASNTTKVSQPVGEPNVSVEEMKRVFSSNEEMVKLNFDKAQKALQQYRDPNDNSTIRLEPYDRNTIRKFLQKPASNESNLRKVAGYLFYRSQILYRLVHWYAGMWDLRCRNVEPKYDLVNGLDKNVLKYYNDTVNQLDIYNLQENLYEVFVNCYLYDTCYFLWFRDKTGAIPFIIDPEFCKVMGRYMSGDISYCIDMSKFSNKQGQNLIGWLGSPLKEMYDEYQRTKVKYIQVPDKYAGCFKFNIHNLFLNVPPFAPIFQTLSTLLDTEDLAAVQDRLDVFKMVVMPMKTLKKQMNDWEIDPELQLKYFDQMVKDALPDFISAVPVPGEGLDTIDFSSSSADKQVDRVANAQKNIMSTSGGGAVLNSSAISSTAAFNAWLQEETDFAISSLIGQVDGFTNRMLSYDISNPCKVKHFEISEYTKKTFRDAFLEAGQYSLSYRLALGTLYGMSEKATLAALHFEQETLGLQNLMIYPLQSSYTQTSTTEGTDLVSGGRPEKDAGELSPSGDRSRNQ